MAVKRIVPNIAAPDPSAAEAFYGQGLGLAKLMDLGWVATFGEGAAQISFAREGGNGAPVPDLTVEVDDLDAILASLRAGGFAIEYGPVDEPWGVHRFFVRDPFGRLVNVMRHRGG